MRIQRRISNGDNNKKAKYIFGVFLSLFGHWKETFFPNKNSISRWSYERWRRRWWRRFIFGQMEVVIVSWIERESLCVTDSMAICEVCCRFWTSNSSNLFCEKVFFFCRDVINLLSRHSHTHRDLHLPRNAEKNAIIHAYLFDYFWPFFSSFFFVPSSVVDCCPKSLWRIPCKLHIFVASTTLWWWRRVGKEQGTIVADYFDAVVKPLNVKQYQQAMHSDARCIQNRQ